MAWTKIISNKTKMSYLGQTHCEIIINGPSECDRIGGASEINSVRSRRSALE